MAKIIIPALVFLTTCAGCYPFFHQPTKQVIVYENDDKRLYELEKRIALIETEIYMTRERSEKLYTELSDALATTDADITRLQAALYNNSESIYLMMNQINLMDANVANIVERIATLEANVTYNYALIAELQTRATVTELINPCGDTPGKVDEILLRLSTDDIVVFFQSNDGERLSTLEPGNYRTTDGTNCSFTVNADKSVTWSN